MHLGEDHDGRERPAADALTLALQGRGLRVTPQRQLIARALAGLGRHATAEEVLAAARGDLPGVALPTIYATLDLLAELGLVRRVSSGVGPALYDPQLDGHHHLACRRCGTVRDLAAPLDRPAAQPALQAARAAGWDAVSGEVVVSGLCPRCLS